MAQIPKGRKKKKKEKQDAKTAIDA